MGEAIVLVFGSTFLLASGFLLGYFWRDRELVPLRCLICGMRRYV